MTESVVIDIGTQALQLTLLIALPLLGVSLVVGLVVSLFQVATSLQDVTLTFVPKILAVGLTLIFAAHWMLSTLITYTTNLISNLSKVIG